MKSDYDRVSSIENSKKWLLYISTVISLLLTLNEKYKWSEIYKQLADYTDLVIAINSSIVFIYICLDIRGNLLYSRAEKYRTLQYVDNSFDTNFAGKQVESYFTQDKLEPGFYKLNVNCFENTFHTFNIARAMQKESYTKSVSILVIFMFSAIVGEKGLVRYLFEAILPLSSIQSSIRLFFFVSKLENLLEVFSSFFTSIKTTSFGDREPEALKNVITYETTLSWASIPLDSKIFFKLREKLATEWEELKNQYQIN